MQPDTRELLRQFLRKWSTHDLDGPARRVLQEEVRTLRGLLAAMGERSHVLDGAENAPDRHWFAEKFHAV